MGKLYFFYVAINIKSANINCICLTVGICVWKQFNIAAVGQNPGWIGPERGIFKRTQCRILLLVIRRLESFEVLHQVHFNNPGLRLVITLHNEKESIFIESLILDADCPVTVLQYLYTRQSCGVVNSWDLLNFSETEIIVALASQRVKAVQRIT